MVHVLSLLHSTDLHCKQSLGIALLSQLILSSDFQKQNKCLNTSNVPADAVCTPSFRQSLLQKPAVLVTLILDISSGSEPDRDEKKYCVFASVRVITRKAG